MRDVKSLPKAHLHVHLDAAVRSSTIIELAGRAGQDVPQLSGFTNFDEFIASYFELLKLTQDRQVFRRVIDEAVEDAKIDGVRYLELAINPEFHAVGWGSTEAALIGTLEQGAESAARYGVAVGFNLTVDRMAGYDASIETARLAVRYAGEGVRTLGLANEERGYPAGDFVEAFSIARNAGLDRAPHAGELVGAESVRSALDNLRATRVQHGVRAVEDPSLLDRLAEEGVCLDVCPTSNVVLGVYPTIEEHPLQRLLLAGVRCSINADDPTLFNVGIADEYEMARSTLGLDDVQLADCARSSIECSAAPPETKREALRDIEAWLQVTA